MGQSSNDRINNPSTHTNDHIGVQDEGLILKEILKCDYSVKFQEVSEKGYNIE